MFSVMHELHEQTLPENLYIVGLTSLTMEYSFVYFTCGSKEEAHTIARSLLEKRLIACANIFSVSSVYTWKGAVEEAEEYAAFLKTESTKVARTIEEVKRQHSYEVPDIVEIPLGEGYLPFFQWISEVVQ